MGQSVLSSEWRWPSGPETEDQHRSVVERRLNMPFDAGMFLDACDVNAGSFQVADMTEFNSELADSEWESTRYLVHIGPSRGRGRGAKFPKPYYRLWSVSISCMADYDEAEDEGGRVCREEASTLFVSSYDALDAIKSRVPRALIRIREYW